jgi:hypothetical protein
VNLLHLDYASSAGVGYTLYLFNFIYAFVYLIVTSFFFMVSNGTPGVQESKNTTLNPAILAGFWWEAFGPLAPLVI